MKNANDRKANKCQIQQRVAGEDGGQRRKPKRAKKLIGSRNTDIRRD